MLWKAVILTAFAFAALPGGALGATAMLVTDSGVPCGSTAESCSVSYLAGPGEANDIQATKIGEVVTIVDTGATITAGSGCTNVSAQEVTCSPAAGAFLDLGDLDDEVVMASGENWAVVGDAGNDELTLCPDCRAHYLAGNTGDDSLRGGNGDDSLIGGDGNDTLVGGIGRDHLAPREGDDSVAAGSGRDTVSYEGLSVRHGLVADLRSGTVTGAGTDTLTGAEDFIGTQYVDRITGSTGANLLSGLGGEDLLVGKAGMDVLIGGPHADRLFGQKGPDRLVAEGGTDLLVGGSEADLLLAGPGADTLLVRDGVQDVLQGNAGTDRARIDHGLDRAFGIEAFF